MPVFSIIGEGKTDHAVLRNILIGYFNDPDEDKLRFIYDQPLHDETDRNKAADQDHFGGWVKVLDYCSSEEFKNSTGFNDYIIIQIDTDRLHEPGFGVDFNADLDAYLSSIKDKLITTIGQDFYLTIQNKTFFAICVKGVECWLLPIRYAGKDNSKTNKIDNCTRLMEESIKKALQKDYDTYLDLSKDYRKTKKLRQLYDKNPSLKIFIKSLDTHFTTTTP